MIKFRQKEYSRKGVIKTLGFVKGRIDGVDKAIINGGLKLQDKLGIGNGKLVPKSAKKIKIPEKSKRQITRESLQTVRKAEETGRKVVNTPINEALDMGLRYASGNPLTAVSSLAPIPGSTVIGMAGEKSIKSKIPGYSKATDKLQRAYNKSLISKGLRKTRLPSLEEIPMLI